MHLRLSHTRSDPTLSSLIEMVLVPPDIVFLRWKVHHNFRFRGQKENRSHRSGVTRRRRRWMFGCRYCCSRTRHRAPRGRDLARGLVRQGELTLENDAVGKAEKFRSVRLVRRSHSCHSETACSTFSDVDARLRQAHGRESPSERVGSSSSAPSYARAPVLYEAPPAHLDLRGERGPRQDLAASAVLVAMPAIRGYPGAAAAGLVRTPTAEESRLGLGSSWRPTRHDCACSWRCLGEDLDALLLCQWIGTCDVASDSAEASLAKFRTQRQDGKQAGRKCRSRHDASIMPMVPDDQRDCVIASLCRDEVTKRRIRMLTYFTCEIAELCDPRMSDKASLQLHWHDDGSTVMRQHVDRQTFKKPSLALI